MPLTKYVKAEGERKRYSIDYSEWLDTGETLLGVIFTVPDNSMTTPLVVDDVMVEPDATGVQYYVSGGVDGANYEVVATATTSGAQVKEDSILFTIREPQ